MSRNKAAKITVSVWAALLLAVFAVCTSPVVLAAVLLAALCHEWGHYGVLRCCGAAVEEIRISLYGAQIRLAERPVLSYGRELLAVLAGPIVNIALALLLARCGAWGDVFFLLSGAQLVLGGFNLLPVRPLDGGSALWLALAWGSDPVAADRVMRWIERVMLVLLTALALWIWRRTGSPFLLLGITGLWKPMRPEKKLVKRGKRR